MKPKGKKMMKPLLRIGLAALAITTLGLIATAAEKKETEANDYSRPVARAVEPGNGTAENTKPVLEILHQTGIRVVAQINYADTMPNGISKQIMAVKNLYDQYAALGMKPGKDYDIVMVFRADGAQFLLADEAYDLKVKQPHPIGNPSKTMIEALHKGGVKMYECHVAMTLKGYKPEDIFPFSRVVVSGIGAVVDFEKSGYLPITP